MLLRGRGVLSSISNLNVANVPKETRKLIQAGADKVNQTLNGVRSTFGTWSQVENIPILSVMFLTLFFQNSEAQE